MKKILTIAIVLIAISLNAEFKRYFNAGKKPLDKRIQKGPYVLICQTKEELNMSGNSANIVWESETVIEEVTFTNMEGKTITEEREKIIWTPRLKTTQELANESRGSFKSQLAGELIRYLNSRYNTDEKIGLLMMDKYGNNAQKQAVVAIKDWIGIVQADFVTRLAQITNAKDMEALNAISMDFTNHDATKPPYTYQDILIME